MSIRNIVAMDVQCASVCAVLEAMEISILSIMLTEHCSVLISGSPVLCSSLPRRVSEIYAN